MALGVESRGGNCHVSQREAVTLGGNILKEKDGDQETRQQQYRATHVVLSNRCRPLQRMRPSLLESQFWRGLLWGGVFPLPQQLPTQSQSKICQNCHKRRLKMPCSRLLLTVLLVRLLLHSAVSQGDNVPDPIGDLLGGLQACLAHCFMGIVNLQLLGKIFRGSFGS